MDWTAIGVGVTVFGGLVGWLYAGLKGEIAAIKQENGALAAKLQQHEVTVAKDYALRDDLERALDKLSTALFAKLDRIENKLDQKVDKP